MTSAEFLVPVAVRLAAQGSWVKISAVRTLPRTMPPKPDDIQMSFGEHLEELRRRLIYALLGVAAACGLTFFYASAILHWLCQPLFAALRDAGLPQHVVNRSVTSGFMAWTMVGLVGGVIVAAPWVVYQLWKFVSAGLYAHERRGVLVLAPFSLLMTVLGVAFFRYVMLPVSVSFLVSFSTGLRLEAPAPPLAAQRAPELSEPAPPPIPILEHDPAPPLEGQLWYNATERLLKVHVQGQTLHVSVTTPSLMTPLIEIGEYLQFVTLLALGIVIAFQVPVVMTFLGSTGVIDPQAVTRARKYCIFVCFAAGAVLTPADVMSMLLLALPLWALFEMGLVLMRLAYGRHGRHG